MKYEYKTVGLVPPKEVDTILTTQGAEGWRVVKLWTTSVPYGLYYTALLERALP